MIATLPPSTMPVDSMSGSERNHHEELLTRAATDEAAAAELVASLYGELRVVARRLLARESPAHTLQPTALVNELYLKLIDQTRVPAEGRAHFMRLAARAMRQILINHAEARGAQKRGGGWERLPLEHHVAEFSGRSTDLLALDEALQGLAARKERVASVVEMRFFGGMTTEEIAEVLGVSVRTVAMDWEFARAWIGRELGGDRAP